MARHKSTPKRCIRQPQQARARATVEAIIEASARLLASDGWAKVTTNHIARTAGVSIGTLYEYFPNKQAIVEVLLDRHLGEGEARLAAYLAATKCPVDIPLNAWIGELVDGFLALHERDPILHRRLSSEVPISAAMQKRMERLSNTLVGHVADLLRRHPEARVEDPDVSARLMVDTVDALTHRWVVEPGGRPVPARQLAAALAKMLSRFVGVDAPKNR